MGTLRTDSVSNLTGTKTATTDQIADGIAKAWVNFNGTGTPAIRKSMNVSSITDTAVGRWTVNFSTPMTDALYAFSASGGAQAANNFSVYQDVSIPLTTSAIAICATGNNTTSVDTQLLTVAIFD